MLADLRKLMNGNKPRPGWPLPAIPNCYLIAIAKSGRDFDRAVDVLIANGWRLDEGIDSWVFSANG